MTIWVTLPEMRLDLHFSPQLMLYSSLFKLLFEEHLQSQDELSLSFSGQVNIPKLSLAQRTTNIKVFQAPSLPV